VFSSRESTNGEEALKTLLLRADRYDWRDDEEFRRGKDGLLRGHLVAARHMAGRALACCVAFSQTALDIARPRCPGPVQVVLPRA
jgi:hypothetical protein